MLNWLPQKKKINDKTENINKKESKIMEKPQICLFDFNDEDMNLLKEDGFNITCATLGAEVKVPNNKIYDQHLCLLNFTFPENLHEYDIIVINLLEKRQIEYNPEEHIKNSSKNFESIYFASRYPQTIFDPRPFSSHILKEYIDELLEKKFILIVFASADEQIKYLSASIKPDGFRYEPLNNACSIYSFCNLLPISAKKHGYELDVVIKHEGLRALLLKNLKDFSYNITFTHPTSITFHKDIDV